MYKECKTEQSATHQRDLAFGLLNLMDEIPYEKITVSNFCAYMKIPRKAFYRYFTSKEDALETLVSLVLLDIGTYQIPAEVTAEDAILEESLRFFFYWSDNRRILEILLKNSQMEIFFFQTVSLCLTEMNIFHRLLGHLDSLSQESIVSYYIGGILSMLMFWTKNHFPESADVMAQRLVRLVGSPLPNPNS